MPNPRLANRYAKSLVDLAIEQNQLELVYNDMKYLQAVCKGSKDFVNLLKSPIIKADKKVAIIEAITASKVTTLTNLFTKLLVTKSRERDLPEIAAAFIDQYNVIKRIHKVVLTTAVEIGEDLKNSIKAKAEAVKSIGIVELETKIDERLIGGFVLEFENKLVDASVARDLRDVKKQFAKNVYVSNLG